MNHDIMTTKEAAKYLRITRQTLMKLVSKNHISSNKIGRNYRFLKLELDNFIEINNTKNKEAEKTDYYNIKNIIDSSPNSKLIPFELCGAGTTPHHNYVKYLCPYNDKDYGVFNRLCSMPDKIYKCIHFLGIFDNHILCDSEMPQLVATIRNNEISIDIQYIK